jgi:uncharacterized protein (TIGR02118 family)
MAGAKVIVAYPYPKDVATFEKAYSTEHVPMAGPIFAGTGAKKVVFTKLAETPQGKPAFHRIVEFHYATMGELQNALASPDVKRAVEHAHKISSGGPPVIMISGEEETRPL